MVALSRTKRRLASARGDVRDRVGPAAGSARVSLGVALDDTRSRVGPALDDAKQRIAPALVDARDKLAPALEETRDRIVPALEDARDKLIPVAQQAVVSSRLKGRRAAVKLGLAEEEKTSHKLRNLLVLLGLGGAGFLAWKRFFGADDSWSEAPSRSPEPAPRHEFPHRNTEAAPTAPLASEETVESHDPTTPDSPLEEKAVDKEL